MIDQLNQKLRAGAAALAVGLLAGCSATGPHHASLTTTHDSANPAGTTRARSIMSAERAVAADQDDARARLRLAQAYLHDGRFASARQAALEAFELADLDDADPELAVGALDLALAEIALDRRAEALETLATRGQAIPAADMGLALALAGNARQGRTILTNALRNGENTPRLRQNLALAYAMGGAWSEARLVAAQDVPANTLETRLRTWAALVQPGATRQLIANLLGVEPRDDPGEPTSLALVRSPEPAAPSAPATVLPVSALALIAPATMQPVPVPDFAPSARIGTNPTAGHGPAAVMPQHITHLVQLGAFSSEAAARRGWTILTRHNARIDHRLFGQPPVITRVVVGSRTLWRLQAGRFDGAVAATATCGAFRARGGACVVVALGAPRIQGPIFALPRAARR